VGEELRDEIMPNNIIMIGLPALEKLKSPVVWQNSQRHPS